MHKYELTERGKIIIAILVVLIFLVLPAAILAYKAWAAQPQAPPPNETTETSGPPSASIETPPLIYESPPPNGGGFNPPNINGNGAGGQDPSRPPEFGPSGGTPSEGTLSFLFSPRLQNTLDAETTSLLGEFLNSPYNTEDTQIAIEMPQLSGEDSEKLISALISAFAALGVRESRLAFIMQSTVESEGAVEVNLSFVDSSQK